MAETRGVRALLVIVAATLLLGGCGDDNSSSDGEGLCANMLEYAGHEYSGHGELKRDPPTTGRVESGSVPGCEGDAHDIEVEELVDLPMNRALLARGVFYHRSDLPFPSEARGWFVPQPCDSSGSFNLRGDWLGVQGPNPPRFDGDLRPPYRLQVHITDGPSDYLATTIQIHATEETDPALSPKDVKTSLWEGGGLVARVHCEDRKFVAETLSSTPG